MTENYVQKMSVATSERGRVCRILGTVLEFTSLIFILLAAFVNVYFLIGLFVMFGAGVAVLQIYNNEYKTFEYDFNRTRLVVTATTSINRKRTLAEIRFAGVTAFEASKGDAEQSVKACENAAADGVFMITYDDLGFEKKVAIQPDDYLKTLIQGVLNEKKADKPEEKE